MAGRINWLSDCGKGYSRTSPVAVRVVGGVGVGWALATVDRDVPGCVTFICTFGGVTTPESTEIMTMLRSSRTTNKEASRRRRIDQPTGRLALVGMASCFDLVLSSPLSSFPL